MGHCAVPWNRHPSRGERHRQRLLLWIVYRKPTRHMCSACMSHLSQLRVEPVRSLRSGRDRLRLVGMLYGLLLPALESAPPCFLQGGRAVNKTWKRSVILILSVTAGVVGGVLAKQARPQSPLQPFTLDITETSVDAQGKPDTEPKFVRLSVREDGSTSKATRIRRRSDGAELVSRIIYDLARRRKISIDPVTESTTTVPLSSADVQLHLVSAATACSGTAAGQILGREVYFVEENRTRKDSNGAIPIEHIEKWIAPSLGCLPLRWDGTLYKPDGTFFIRNVRAVDSITQGIADGAFEVPPGYVERSPSELMKERERRWPGLYKVPDLTGPDKVYFEKRANPPN